VIELHAAIHWAASARLHHHKSTIYAYSTSLRLLDRCLNLHPNVDLQHKFLATARIPRSLASDAASAAIDAGDPKAAVELLEQGRTIMWSRMARYRHPLDQLRQVNKDLADRLQALTVALEHLSFSSGSRPLGSTGYMEPDLEVQMKRNRHLSEDLEEILGKVREIEGFGNFLQAVPFTTLRAAAAEGPVILINISDYRSDALILHTGVDDLPSLVPLPNVRREDLIHLAQQLALAQVGAELIAQKLYFQFCATYGITLFLLWLIVFLRWEYQRRVGFGGAQRPSCALYPSMLQVHTSKGKESSRHLHIFLYANSICINQSKISHSHISPVCCPQVTCHWSTWRIPAKCTERN
jgi:hypothetical protein